MITKTKLGFASLLFLALVLLPAQAAFAITVECNDGSEVEASLNALENSDPCAAHGGVEHAADRTVTTGDCPDGYVELSVAPGDINNDSNGRASIPDNCVSEGSGSLDDNPIITYLKSIINFLAIGVGLVTAISIVIGGFQFMSSRDNPQSIQAAQKRIWNGVIALLLFIFMYAILNFLVPGGLIG